MFNGRWWIGIAISLAVFLTITISPAVMPQKQGAGQEKAKAGSDKQQKQKPGIEAKTKGDHAHKKAGDHKGNFGLAKLNLGPEQKAAIEPILKRAKEKIIALKATAEGKDISQLKAELSAIRAEAEKQIAAILTPEQLKLWQEMKQRRTEKRAKKFARGACPAPAE